ncbi:MAG: hypothetical protein E8D46_11300 [Nitrospira sp.]|nr:MAG: hypothetical protein E8D46_11300 [Nitrospira sp.]
MDKQQAKQVLRAELVKWRLKPYAELEGLIGKPHQIEVPNPSGGSYQVEIEVYWDSVPGQALRVIGLIDDGGWRAFFPLSDDFILSPNGSFIGEDAG